MKRLVLLPFVLIFLGCSTTEYVGDTYAATEHVDVYRNTNSISRPYHTIGSAKTSAHHFTSFEQLQKRLVKDAKAKGADAILIESMDTLGFISSISNQGTQNPGNEMTEGGESTEVVGEDGDSSSTKSERSRDSVITAKLLKYTD